MTEDSIFLDRDLEHIVDMATERFRAAGMKDEDVSDAIDEVLDRTLAATADDFTDDLFKRASKMLSDYRRSDAHQRRELRAIWGPALDVYRMIWVGAHEMGDRYSKEHQVDGEPMDPLANALLGLQARAIRVAAEVYVLLENGMGMGALARARTAHEVAVASFVLSEHAGTPGHEDLAQRFLNHHAVTDYSDAVQYQQVCESIGYQPYTDSEMERLKQLRDTVVAKYGATYAKPNGWAAGIVAPHAPKFVELESIAGLEHFRAHYRWSSHEVHSDAKSWVLNNTREWQGIRFRDTGASLDGLADPADMTLIALVQVTTNMVLHASAEIRFRDVLQVQVLSRLLDRAQEAFIGAHDVVEEMRGREPSSLS